MAADGLNSREGEHRMWYGVAVIPLVLCGCMGGPSTGARAGSGPIADPQRQVGPATAPEPATHSKPGATIETEPAPVRNTPVVRAMGIGRPPRRMKGARAKLMARRAAEVVAVRNLGRKMGYGPRASIRGFRYVSTEFLIDGSVRVTVESPWAPRPPKPKAGTSPRSGTAEGSPG